jgi:hypothetical protein
MSEQRARCKQIRWPRKPRFFVIVPDQGVGGQELKTFTFLLGVINGADGGGRTHTLSRVPDFESSASANSATSATLITKHLCKFVPGDVDAAPRLVQETGLAKQGNANSGLSQPERRFAFASRRNIQGAAGPAQAPNSPRPICRICLPDAFLALSSQQHQVEHSGFLGNALLRVPPPKATGPGCILPHCT